LEEVQVYFNIEDHIKGRDCKVDIGT